MLNLVDKYAVADDTDSDEGVVAVEYVLIAGLVAAGVAVTFATDFWTTLKGVLEAALD